MIVQLTVLSLLLIVGINAVQSVSPIHVRVQHNAVEYHPDVVIDTHNPHFSWQLEDEIDSNLKPIRGVVQTAYQLKITTVSTGEIYDTGIVSSAQSTQVVYQGAKLQSDSRYEYTIQYWSSTGKVSSVFRGKFRTALMNPDVDFQGNWIGSNRIIMNQLRKEFAVPSNYQSATLYMSGIGYSTLYLNGEAVDPSRKLDPGWTTFEMRALYVSFDLSMLLSPGQNCLGIELGNGWYSQEQYWNGQHENSYGPPRVILQLNIQTTNGTVSIVSDNTWTGRTGPNVHDGVYMGTYHDARVRREGWNKVGFSDMTSLWLTADTMNSPLGSTGILSLQPMDPIRTGPNALHIATSASRLGGTGQPDYIQGGSLMNGGILKVVNVGGIGHGVLDLGQNFAGWCQFNMTGPLGLSVHFRHAEVLTQPMANGNSYGDIYTDNLRDAAQTDTYVFAGTGSDETFEPEFTVHGFRYVSVLGYNIDSTKVQCFQAHSETTLIGNFTSSSAVINQIQHNVQWGQLSNSMSLPSDCPQRDERKGWMGDAGLTVDESLYNFDYANFYGNFLDLISDIQGSDGTVTDTVPFTFGGRPADPNWGTAYPTIAFTLYNHYGDLTILSKHYAGLVAYVDYVYSRYQNGGLKNMFSSYGDWVPPPPYGQSNINLISSFPFLRDVYTLANISSLLGNQSNADRYSSLYKQLAGEWHSTWYNASEGGYADNMQTANALSLALPSVVPQNLRATVLKTLITDLQSKGHVTTGIVGIAQLYPVLSENGFNDLAVQLASSITYPSFGYMFNNPWENATTVWEVWNAPLRSDGPEMNSRNHHMFSTIGGWFYRYLAGVNLNGLDEIIIHPRLTNDMNLLSNISAEVYTIKGPVLVDYVREDDGVTVTYKITVPHNTHAVLSFDPISPKAVLNQLSESGSALWKRAYYVSTGYESEHLNLMNAVSGLEWVKVDADSRVVSARVGGGSYVWSVVWA